MSNTGFSKEEKDAMRARAKELKQEEKLLKNREAGEKAILEEIKKMGRNDAEMAKRIHSLITQNFSDLMPKTWYGMPAYANQEGKVICFFQASSKFQSRYSTLGFNDVAILDEGNMWPTSFAITKLTENEELAILQLLKKATSS